jgi:hypothetical protein
MGLVGKYTSLRFARHPRVLFEVPVEVRVFGDEYVLESANIGVSGIAVRSFPRIIEGTIVRLVLQLSDGPLNASARVVRHGSDGAGLEFVDLSFDDRDRIARIVQSGISNQWTDRMSSLEELFTRDLDARSAADPLKTGDISAMKEPRDQGDLMGADLAVLRALIIEDWSIADGAPDWLRRCAQEITNVEGDAIMGLDVPSWVSDALSMRLRLARMRVENGLSEKPEQFRAVAISAYRLFLQLAQVARHESSQVVAQIAKIRATFLRDLLWGRVQGRTGASIPQTHAGAAATEEAARVV